MVGLHNLYWYYGSQTYKQEGTDKLVHTSEAFQGSVYYVLCGICLFLSSDIMFAGTKMHLISLISSKQRIFVTFC